MKRQQTLELQADCFAGVWGYYAAQNKRLEPGDVEEGLAAANAIGDDTLQRGAGQRLHTRCLYTRQLRAAYALV
jgi:predicted metalloprotease